MNEMQAELTGGRCDTCNARLEIGKTVYVHHTPSTGTMEQAQAGEAFWAEDPEWGLCQICHEITMAYVNGYVGFTETIVALVKRSMTNDQFMVIGAESGFVEKMHEDQMKFKVGVVRAFLENRTAEFEEEVNAGVPR